MTYQQLLDCLELSQLSPEELSHYLGVSNMTIRRWKKRPTDQVDPSYTAAAYSGILGLVADGKLDMEHPQVKQILLARVEGYNEKYARAVLRSFGVSQPVELGVSTELQLQKSLAESGGHIRHQERVLQAEAEVLGFAERGEDWKQKIHALWEVLRSSTIPVAQKSTAIGALFYLLMTFDFIPDHLPVFGLLDDFALLGVALEHYRRKTI